VKLPYIATVGILASKGLGQAEGVVLVLERRKFPDIFVTSTGGRESIHENANFTNESLTLQRPYSGLRRTSVQVGEKGR